MKKALWIVHHLKIFFLILFEHSRKGATNLVYGSFKSLKEKIKYFNNFKHYHQMFIFINVSFTCDYMTLIQSMFSRECPTNIQILPLFATVKVHQFCI